MPSEEKNVLFTISAIFVRALGIDGIKEMSRDISGGNKWQHLPILAIAVEFVILSKRDNDTSHVKCVHNWSFNKFYRIIVQCEDICDPYGIQKKLLSITPIICHSCVQDKKFSM